MAEDKDDLADDKGKTGDDGSAANKAGKNTGDATGKKADKSSGKGKDKSSEGGDDDQKPKGKMMSDDDINSIVQTRLARERKKDADNAKLTETERLTKERDEALTKAAESDIKDAFITESGLEYAKALKLFRMYRPDIETDDKNKPTNLKDVMKTARDEYPELFPSKLPKNKGDAAKTGDNSSGSSFNDAIRRRAGRS